MLTEFVREVLVIDDLFTGDEGNLSSALKSVRAVLYCDYAEFKKSLDYIFKKHQIDSVFKFATEALNYFFLNSVNALLTNVNVLFNLLELQRRRLVKPLFYFSTYEVDHFFWSTR